jgi:hypothetical protein
VYQGNGTVKQQCDNSKSKSVITVQQQCHHDCPHHRKYRNHQHHKFARTITTTTTTISALEFAFRGVCTDDNLPTTNTIAITTIITTIITIITITRVCFPWDLH